MNEEEFRNLAKEKGYGEVELLEVDPGPEVFITGDFCENPAGTMHQEKAGPDGSSFLYAKKFS